MASDIPAHPPFTGEPGGAPEYAPGESPPEVSPESPIEAPVSEPFGDDGSPSSNRVGFDTGPFPRSSPD